MAERVIAGRYRLDEPLGVGGTASVWSAFDVVLERPVAVKVLARDADSARFEREARAAAALAHPNVARVFDYGESEDGLYIVLEHLPGGTLEERLPAGRPVDDEETARIAGAVAEGLAFAHAAGLVHRDLKPANVLFDAEDRPKISDFGIARLTGAATLTEAGTVLGTAAYISPEQALGEPATAASDVYSFGVILFRMLTGRLPFEADEPLELAAMHAHEQPPSIASLRPDAPARLESLATAALAKDPRDRPPDGAAVAAELAGAAAPTVLAAPRTRRPRRAAAVAVAVPLLAGAGVGLALLAQRDADGPDPAVETTRPAPSIAAATETETGPASAPEPAPEPEPEPEPTTTSPPTTETAPTETAPTETAPAETETAPPEPPPTETAPTATGP